MSIGGGSQRRISGFVTGVGVLVYFAYNVFKSPPPAAPRRKRWLINSEFAAPAAKMCLMHSIFSIGLARARIYSAVICRACRAVSIKN